MVFKNKIAERKKTECRWLPGLGLPWVWLGAEPVQVGLVMPSPGIAALEAALGGSVSNPSCFQQPTWGDCPEQHPKESSTSSSWHFPTSHPWQASAGFPKVTGMQQYEYIPVAAAFSPLWRRVIEPQCLQAKTTSTEDKTALVHQSSKQYRGEFLIFLNCHLETIHHPLLKPSGGGWVTSRDSRFMCKLWWEHVYCCATCTWYCSFLVSKQSERVRKRRDSHSWVKEFNQNLLRALYQLWGVCVRAHRGKRAGRREQECGDERMGNDSTASHSALWLDPVGWILHWLLYNVFLPLWLSYPRPGVPRGQCRLAPTAQGIF